MRPERKRLGYHSRRCGHRQTDVRPLEFEKESFGLAAPEQVSNSETLLREALGGLEANFVNVTVTGQPLSKEQSTFTCPQRRPSTCPKPSRYWVSSNTLHVY